MLKFKKPIVKNKSFLKKPIVKTLDNIKNGKIGIDERLFLVRAPEEMLASMLYRFDSDNKDPLIKEIARIFVLKTDKRAFTLALKITPFSQAKDLLKTTFLLQKFEPETKRNIKELFKSVTKDEKIDLRLRKYANYLLRKIYKNFIF